MPARALDIIVTDRSQQVNRPDLVQAIAPYVAVSWSIGHDIANPLTGIVGLTDELLAEDEPLSDSQRESLGMISECADRIFDILQALAQTKSVIMDDDYLRNKIETVIGRIDRTTIDG